MWNKRIRQLYNILRWTTVILTFISIGWLIYDIGFQHPEFHVLRGVYQLYLVTFLINIGTITFRYVLPRNRPPRKLWFFDGLILASMIGIVGKVLLPEQIDSAFITTDGAWIWVFVTLILGLIREIFITNIHQAFMDFNPAQLFVGSYIAMILLGTLALLLPTATYERITFVDALFTATSAICITGMMVLDTTTDFTPFGQGLILFMFQLGGLGIMTFTSFFSYFFRGQTSYKNQLLIREITYSGRLNQAYSMLKTILIYTLGFEFMGTLLIFWSLGDTTMANISSRLYFSIFHAISSFCNAGFSILPEGLFTASLRFNYPFQIITVWLFIFGGLGFPIVFNFIQYARYYIVHSVFSIRERLPFVHRPWIININTRIVLIATGILIVAGTVMFYIFEYNHTLAEHSWWGKIVVSFFNGTTPRTAGFNSVMINELQLGTLMVIIFLMWIGASPMSTGGGIKTTTFAIAVLNIVNMVQGKDRIEVFRRQISDESVKRAFAVVYLSLLVISSSTLLIQIFDPHLEALPTIFEVFAAYSTAGLSMGITDQLSTGSKLVLMGTMFMGRVSMFTILIAIFRRFHAQNYRYPVEDIMIN